MLSEDEPDKYTHLNGVAVWCLFFPFRPSNRAHSILSFSFHQLFFFFPLPLCFSFFFSSVQQRLRQGLISIWALAQ